MYYRRSKVEGGTCFFTVNLAEHQSDFLVRHIDKLQAVIERVKNAPSVCDNRDDSVARASSHNLAPACW